MGSHHVLRGSYLRAVVCTMIGCFQVDWGGGLVEGMFSLPFLLWCYPCAFASRSLQTSILGWGRQTLQMWTMTTLCKVMKDSALQIPSMTLSLRPTMIFTDSGESDLQSTSLTYFSLLDNSFIYHEVKLEQALKKPPRGTNTGQGQGRILLPEHDSCLFWGVEGSNCEFVSFARVNRVK